MYMRYTQGQSEEEYVLNRRLLSKFYCIHMTQVSNYSNSVCNPPFKSCVQTCIHAHASLFSHQKYSETTIIQDSMGFKVDHVRLQRFSDSPVFLSTVEPL